VGQKNQSARIPARYHHRLGSLGLVCGQAVRGSTSKEDVAIRRLLVPTGLGKNAREIADVEIEPATRGIEVRSRHPHCPSRASVIGRRGTRRGRHRIRAEPGKADQKSRFSFNIS